MNVIPLQSGILHLPPERARYAFVVPRFGEGCGGAENLVSALAEKLAQRGNPVEILTTCARDNRTWANDWPSGRSEERGLVVRRFPVSERNLESWIPKQIALSTGNRLSVPDQIAWMSESVTSEELFGHILLSRQNFDAFIFAPYLFGTTFWGAYLVPEKAYLLPCLHDEYVAYTDIMHSLFRTIDGAIFNSEPEMELAHRLYGGVPGGVVGLGFDPIPISERESLNPYFKNSFPYLLYLGRKETGKNAQVLLDNFIAYKDKFCTDAAYAENKKAMGKDLKLVIAGGGSFSDLERPGAERREDVIDLPHVSEYEKKRLLRHAVALCQPSTNESFSIVMMESWLLETPVLVSSHSPVTSYHARKSGGGLFFADQTEFFYCLESLLAPDLRLALGSSGRRYVESEYDWPSVIRRFDKVTQGFFSARV